MCLFAGLVLAAGLFVFASVLNDSFSPVVYQSADDEGDDGRAGDEGFDGELRSDYDYRYGWSFVACSLAFLVSEASAVFTITAYFRRLEDHVRYTAVDRKPSPDTPPSASGDRSSSLCSVDGRADSPDAAAAEAAFRPDHRSLSSSAAAAAGRQPLQCDGGAGGGDCYPAASASSSSSVPSSGGHTATDSNGTSSKTPPDICPPKVGPADGGASAAACKPAAGVYCSATLNHPPAKQHQHQHVHQHQHYRQTLAVGGNGSCYEVDTTKPCTCSSAAGTTTRRYATIAGVARHNGGKQYTTTTTTALAAAAAAAATTNAGNNGTNGGGGGKRSVGLASIKEVVAGLSSAVDHHHHNNNGGGGHHRKPEPPTRRLKASVGGYVVPQTPIAALEALDCPPITDPRLVLPSSV